ncbi:MAG: EAL domain-containing protein [Candidatus Nanopelagicales bacterium]|nr:EAL domain-containing protein [Candidatus Nanopelagicales bacterium]
MTRTRLREFWVIFCMVWAGWVLLRIDRQVENLVLWFILGVASIVLIIVTVARNRPWAPWAWITLAAAIPIGGAGLMLRALQPAGIWGPFDGAMRDLALLAAALVALIVATAGLSRQRRWAAESTGWLDAGLVFCVLFLPTSEFLFYPIWLSTQLPTTEVILLTVVALLTLLLLTMAARLWFVSDGSINVAYRLLCAGIGVLVLSGMVAFALDLARGPGDQLPTAIRVDGFGAWAFLILVGLAVTDPTVRRPPVGDVNRGLIRRGRAMMLITVSVLVPPILLIVHLEGSRFRGSGFFALATALLALLLGLRVNLLVLRYREAIRREQTLREINASLLGVTHLEDISRQISHWSALLVKQDRVTCMIGTEPELGAIGVGGWATRVMEGKRTSHYRTVVAIPGSRPARRLVVDTPDSVDPESLAALAVLGQNIGMALERLSMSRRLVERATAQRLELLLHNASDVIALVDSDGITRYLTAAIEEMTGRPPGEYMGHPWSSMFDDPAFAQALLSRARAQGDGGESAGDLSITLANRSLALRLEVNVAWIGQESQFVVTHHDVTERHALQQELEYRAFHDELTGLKNRAVFREQLDRAAARARRSHRSFAVLMLDLDDFKSINDTLGHPFGDEVLRLVADRLMECMREGDTPVRLGGDEFAAVLESADSGAAAQLVAERLLDRIAKPAQIAGTQLNLRASIGVALSDGSATPEELERDVDIALYDAKFSGKGRLSVYSSAIHDMTVNRISITNDLRDAVSRGEIAIRYQPIVDLTDGSIAGVEALVRWLHPERGELLPATFLDYAEECGEIGPIGQFVIRQSIADLAGWHLRHPQHRDLRLSVNLSSNQLRDKHVRDAILSSLDEHGIGPSQLVIEVTETVLLPGEGSPADHLRSLHDRGISIYIDDFGTGWSSLQYLRSLPVSGLKVAGDFVANLPDPLDLSLVRSIHQLSAALRLENPIAEGVETEQQRESLLSIGFRLAQGFLLAMPENAGDMEATLARTPPASWIASYDRQITGLRPGAPGPAD